MVKESKDFTPEIGPNAPYEFGSARYYPVEQQIHNQREKISTKLPPTSGKILDIILENSPEPVPISIFRQRIWPEMGESQFKQCLKTHLSTLRKCLYLVHLDPDIIDRTGDTLRLRVEVNRLSGLESLTAGHQKEVGSVPRGVAVEFRDRVAESKTVSDLLLRKPNLRAVNIYGRFGVGKTALAYQIMATLLGEQRVNQLVCLSPFTGLGLDQVYRHCGLLLGGQPEHTLKEIWGNVQIPLKQKIHALVEQLRSRRCIILLDSLEESMSEGRLLDSDLNQFLEIFLQQPIQARLLITSNEPLYTASIDLQQFIYHFPLDVGLPKEDAIEFFKSLDYDGSNRFREIPKKLLDTIVNKTQGFPRALTYVANILNTRPTLSLKDLLQKEHLFDAEITYRLGREAQASLGEKERRIMQALSVYNQPVNNNAVAFLVEPFMSASMANEKLDRLARGKFITVSRERGEIRCAAQQWDAKLNYEEIPDDKTKHGRKSWHLRAANYYAQIRPDASTWRTLTSLEASIAEFHHLIKAESYERAYAVVDAVDANYLSAWGYHQRVISMRDLLRGRFSDIREAINLRFLSNAYLNAGKYDMAFSVSRQALDLARKLNNKFEEANAQLYTGWALYHLGRYSLAERHYEAALAVARAAKNKPAEGMILRHLGRLCRNLALHKKALKYYQAALSIAADTHNNVAKCGALNGIGTAYTEMGLFTQSLKCHNEALSIARKLNLKKAKGICLVQAGVALREWGDYERALESFGEALSIARELSDVVTEMQTLGGLGKLYLAQSNFEKARQNIQRALEIATELNMEGAQQHWGTWMAQTYLHLGQLGAAIQIIVNPLKQDTPWNNYRTSLINGIILARNSKGNLRTAAEDARVAFERARVSSDELLMTMPSHYAAQYTKCVALCGLALLNTKKDQHIYLEMGRSSLEEALHRCSAPGVLEDFSKLFNELIPMDRKNALGSVSLVFANKIKLRSKKRQTKDLLPD